MTAPPDHLVALQAELVAEHERLIVQLDAVGERLRLVQAVVDTYEAPTIVEEAKPPRAAKPAPTARPISRNGKRRQHEARACPDCGQTFTHGPALAAHQRSKHPGSAAKPVGPITPTVPSKPASQGLPNFKVLRCECGSEFDSFKALTQHTILDHQREPRALERTPVAPNAAAA